MSGLTSRLRRRVRVLGGPLMGLIVVCSSVAAQQPSTDQPQPTQSGSSVEYRIGPGDMLSIGVAGASQIQHSTRVSNTGKIHVPYVGVIKVVDMTVPELQAEIARQLRERGLVHDAWVSVRIDQYRAQPVYVLGEVMTPGQFVIKDEMYLTDLLTLAAGFNDVASPIGYLYRRKANTESLQPGEAPTDEAIAIDFQALNEGTRPELNLRLRGGDVLYVPQRRREFYFVVGDVGKPGVYEIKKAAGTIRLSQALAQTGGPLPTAKMSAGILVRFDQAGGRQELPVDFKAILEGRQPDLSVQANDIVFIPGSSAKTLALGLLGVIPGLVGQRTTDSLR